MNFGKIFAFLGQLFVTYEEDTAILEAGGVATTSVIEVGTLNGKPIYLRGQLCENNQFPGG